MPIEEVATAGAHTSKPALDEFRVDTPSIRNRARLRHVEDRVLVVTIAQRVDEGRVLLVGHIQKPGGEFEEPRHNKGQSGAVLPHEPCEESLILVAVGVAFGYTVERRGGIPGNADDVLHVQLRLATFSGKE
jgi:hypothetical protein